MIKITIAEAFRMKEMNPTIKSLEFGNKVDLWNAMDPFSVESFTAPATPVRIVTFKHEQDGKNWTSTYELK